MLLRLGHWFVHPLGGRGTWWLPTRIADACWEVCLKYVRRFEND